MHLSRINGLAATLVAATLAGCGGNSDEGTASLKGVGTGEAVVIDGSSTVYRISKAAQEGYAEVNPDVEVVVSNHGTGGGFGAYLRGEVDIVDASRAAKEAEERQAAEKKLDWTRFVVGHDGITVVVNKGNDFVKSLTVEQLKTLWEPGSRVKTWKDLDPSWPAREIKLYSPDKDSGTFEFFTEAIVGKAREQRDDVQASADDTILVRGVAGDADALGYFGYAYYAANSDGLRDVPIADGGEPVAPGPEAILSGAYKPLSRPLFIYVKNAAVRRPEVAGFLTYYLDNIGKLAEEARYVAPTAEEIDQDRAALTALRGGTKPKGEGKAEAGGPK